MPIPKAMVKIKGSRLPSLSAASAEPGQYPTSPQPTPKMTAPKLSLVSMRLPFLGK